MPDEPHCEDALAEVALGIASGEDRARVLAHVADCASCRRLLTQLTDTSDALLSLAPVDEPAAGFEVRVLAGIEAPRPKRRRRFVPAIAATVAAAAVAASSVLVVTRDERRLGRQLEGVLDRAQGSYFAVTELRDARRRKLGVVFHYGGNPSWVFTTFDRPLPPGRYRVALVTRNGTVRPVGTRVLAEGDRSLGFTADLRGVNQLRLRDERRGTTYVARF